MQTILFTVYPGNLIPSESVKYSGAGMGSSWSTSDYPSVLHFSNSLK
jgi:hypothetical protein